MRENRARSAHRTFLAAALVACAIGIASAPSALAQDEGATPGDDDQVVLTGEGVFHLRITDEKHGLRSQAENVSFCGTLRVASDRLELDADGGLIVGRDHSFGGPIFVSGFGLSSGAGGFPASRQPTAARR